MQESESSPQGTVIVYENIVVNVAIVEPNSQPAANTGRRISFEDVPPYFRIGTIRADPSPITPWRHRQARPVPAKRRMINHHIGRI